MPKKPELSDEDVALRKAFGERLRVSREAMGLAPAAMASIGGISLAHQYRIEAGERTAEVLYIQRLSRGLGPVVINMLFGTAALPNSAAAASPAPTMTMTMGDMVSTHAGSVQVGYAGGGNVSVTTGQPPIKGRRK